MKEETVKELLRQRSELSDKLERLKGSRFNMTRDVILKDIKSLDEVLKAYANPT